MTLMVVMYLALLIVAIHLGAAVDAFSVPKWSELSVQRQQQRTQVLGWTSLTNVHDASRRVHTVAISSNIMAMMVLLPPRIAMAATEVELAELPPPWIPVVFGIGLVVVRFEMLIEAAIPKLTLSQKIALVFICCCNNRVLVY